MKPGWTAGATRAVLLLSRTLGEDRARSIASSASLDDGIGALAGSAYGERVQAGLDLPSAQRGVAATLLWHLRILAGWLPAAGARKVRVLAAWFEIANIDARLAALASDGKEPPPFELGALATAWPAIEKAPTVEEMVRALVLSTWGNPGGRSPADVAIGLRVSWARRVVEATPAALDWVAGADALLVARELFVANSRNHLAQLKELPEIGLGPLEARSISELHDKLPSRAAWVLGGITEPYDLWRAELEWWGRVERDAGVMLRRRGDEEIVLAAVALLAADAQHTARALESAAKGGDLQLVEVTDAAA